MGIRNRSYMNSVVVEEHGIDWKDTGFHDCIKGQGWALSFPIVDREVCGEDFCLSESFSFFFLANLYVR